MSLCLSADHDPILEYMNRFLIHCSDIIDRVTVNNDEICEFAGSDAADLIITAHQK